MAGTFSFALTKPVLLGKLWGAWLSIQNEYCMGGIKSGDNMEIAHDKHLVALTRGFDGDFFCGYHGGLMGIFLILKGV